MTRKLSAALALLIAAVTATPAQAQRTEPRPRAPSAIVVEASTGDIAYSRNARSKRAIASTTKLMTALVTRERASLDDVFVAAPYAALPIESKIDLRAGERMSVRDLLRALLLASANDAAVTLAVGTSGSRGKFVADMNARARQLKLRDTRFANPIGLDAPGNHSSARDLATLAIRLRRDPFLRATVDRPRATLTTGARDRAIVNRNRLVREVALVDGVKTGRTLQAGYVLVGSATRNGVSVVSAVLGEPSEAARDRDTLALLRYGLSRYQRATALERGEVKGSVGVRYQDAPVEVAASRTVRRVVRRGERLQVRVQGLPAEVEGPVPRGSRLGTALVRHRGRTVDRVPLVTTAAVAEAPIGDRVKDVAGRSTSVLLLVLLLASSLPLLILRRRALRRRRPARRTPVA